MTYNKKQKSYRKGGGTTRRRSSFLESLSSVLLPLTVLIGLGIFFATNLDFESFLVVQNKTELNENIVEEVDEEIEIEEEEIIEVEKEIERVEEVDDEVYTVVQEMPRFPGCEDLDISVDEKKKCAEKKMLEFIYKNIKYPAIAEDDGVEGMIVLNFIVDKEGNVTNLKLLRGGGELGKEYLRITETMPRWVPGKQHGKPVNDQFNLPILITLER